MKFTTRLQTGVYLDLLKLLEPSILAIPYPSLEDKFPVLAEITPDHDAHIQLSVGFSLPGKKHGYAEVWVDDPSPDSILLRVTFSTDFRRADLRAYITADENHPGNVSAAYAKVVELITKFVTTGDVPDENLGLEPSQVFRAMLHDLDRPSRLMQIPCVGFQYNKDGQIEPMTLRDSL